MNNLTHQHFIPKSYLKNFAINQDNKFFVEGKLKKEAEPKENLICISNICVDKNIYTLPQIKGNDKYSLEKFYAVKVDNVYPKIYKLLTNPLITFITEEQRAQIIMTTMSLFFRTPKFLNLNELKTTEMIDYIVNNYTDNNGNVKFKSKEHDFDFHIDNIDKVKTQLKIKNKIKFLNEHLKDWYKFIQFKLNAGLTVCHIYDDIELITSDNPVIMHSVVGNPFDVFDPTNIINLPLDNKHYLTIFPNTESSLPDRTFRIERDKMFALSTNLQIEENSEEWIIGKPGSIKEHIADQKNTPMILQASQETNEKAFDIQELWKIVEQTGTIYHQEVANKMKELLKKKIHQKEPQMQIMFLDLLKHGFLL